MNLSEFLNTTEHVQIYVDPAQNRHLDPDSSYKESDVNLTWFIDDFDGLNLLVDNKFNNPLEVSPLLKQDELVLHFLGNASDYIYSP